MNVKQFFPFLEEDKKKMVEEENLAFEQFMMFHRMLNAFGLKSSPSVTALRDTTVACASLLHKIKLAFVQGYLCVEANALGTEEDKLRLYKEITEYLSLVEAGIDSFVDAHPIKAIEEGGTDEEQ